jgi:hypothetical protein
MEYGWFLANCQPTCFTLLALTLQHYAAKMIISRMFVISTQGNSGSWENKEFA